MELPICKTCKHCINYKMINGKYEIDCKKNPNLGGVSKKFEKCRSYQEIGKFYKEWLKTL